ncbi:MAG: REP-associated tyrosine transposase [Syntrophobacteraceae bacterium]
MARPLRIEYPGAIYHVTARGKARMPIFEDDRDRTNFLKLIEEAMERFKWHCYAYCLMTKHYHLLVETIQGNLSPGMRHINGVYTQRFNRTHSRVGHLFQGRFKSVVVDRDAYLLELCRYVVLNPVRAGMVECPEEYVWSSYRATAGLSGRPDLLSADWILSRFGGQSGESRKRYVEFVMSGVGANRIWDKLESQCVLGSREFLKGIGPALKDKARYKEIPKCQRLVSRPTLDELLSESGIMGKKERNERLRKAHKEYGYSFSELGRRLGLHYATVSRIVRGE